LQKYGGVPMLIKHSKLVLPCCRWFASCILCCQLGVKFGCGTSVAVAELVLLAKAAGAGWMSIAGRSQSCGTQGPTPKGVVDALVA
jgi:hypothetical protein